MGLVIATSNCSGRAVSGTNAFRRDGPASFCLKVCSSACAKNLTGDLRFRSLSPFAAAAYSDGRRAVRVLHGVRDVHDAAAAADGERRVRAAHRRAPPAARRLHEQQRHQLPLDAGQSVQPPVLGIKFVLDASCDPAAITGTQGSRGSGQAPTVAFVRILQRRPAFKVRVIDQVGSLQITTLDQPEEQISSVTQSSRANQHPKPNLMVQFGGQKETEISHNVKGTLLVINLVELPVSKS